MRRILWLSVVLAALVWGVWVGATRVGATRVGAMCVGAVRVGAIRESPLHESPLRESPLQFSGATYSAGEGEDSAIIGVLLDAASPVTVTVGYLTVNGTFTIDGSAVAGEDYLAISGTLTFTPGVVARAFHVPILDDVRDEADETVALALVNPWNGTLGEFSAATLYILDDDGQPTVRFSAASYTALEMAGSASITVALSNPYTVPVTVDYATSNGTALAGSDYLTASGRLTYTPGVTLGRFTVTILDDSSREGAETVHLSLRDPLSGTLGLFRSATLSIVDEEVYLPLLARRYSLAYTCPATSTNRYGAGVASQVETDDPVRPAYVHADKNIELRGYVPNTDPSLKRELVDYGSDDPTQPPQLATLFDPYRVPVLSEFYQIHQWLWADSPEPGTRGEPEPNPPVTVLGMGAIPGETLYVPKSGYDIGGYEVIVLYADEDTVALKYGREDSAGSAGYTVHVDNICTDPALLALYNALDAEGARYVYVPEEQRPYTYDLPTLGEGQAIGTARDKEVVVAIVDTGQFMDTRSCNEWWQIRPGYAGTCPEP